MSEQKDADVLKGLGEVYVEMCNKPEQDELRELWRQHNSLEHTRPLVLVRGGKAFNYEIPEINELSCEDPLFQGVEKQFRQRLFLASLGDDNVFEPWLTVGAVYTCRGWGVEVPRESAGDDLTAWKAQYPLEQAGDIEKLRTPVHEIDERATQEKLDKLGAVFDGLMPVTVDRGGAYRGFAGDISTDLHFLRGIENFMMDMLDDPEGLHELAGFLRDGILKTHNEAEAAGDWSLVSHNNQAVPYSKELSDPAPDSGSVNRDQLWHFAAAQEFAGVGPDMHEEFLLRYQLPIMSKFGLVAYGCCEDLTNKIDMLRQVPNLRRIAVTPWADVKACAEQIGTDYVMSWRPNPTDMVCAEFSPERIRSITRDALEGCGDKHVDVMLKDIQTVQNEPERLRQWVDITKEIAADYA